jgi:hypothetical protein
MRPTPANFCHGQIAHYATGLASILGFFLLVTNAEAADRVYSDYGSQGTYSGSWWCTMGVAGGCNTPPHTLYNAGGFSPSSSGALDHLDLAMFYSSGLRGISVSLVLDSGSGVPAVQTPLESWIITNTLPNNAFPAQTKPLRIVSKLNPTLQSGKTYWIVTMPLSYDSSAGWSVNVIGVGSSHQAESLDGGVTWNHFGNAPAFDVWIK